MPKPRAMFVLPYVMAREALARPGRERIPEPMIMDDPVSVAEFHANGSVGGGGMLMYEPCAQAMSRLLPRGGTVLDLGSGSGRYLVHLARHRPDVRIVGLDLAPNMLATGRSLVAEEGFADRITLLEADITAFEVPERVDVISCVWTLHHLPTTAHLDACLARIADVRDTHGCAVFLADFARLTHPGSFPAMTWTMATAGPTVRADGIASERAAWSFAELSEALGRAGLGDLHGSVTRGVPVLQVHWADAPGAVDGDDSQLW